MSEDRLLRELGEIAGEEQAAQRADLDERWDRLAAGTLSAAEAAELRALAAAAAEASETYEAFRPLGPDFEARVVSALAAELRSPGAAEETAAGPPPAPRLLRLRRRTAARAAGWLGAAALAAAVLVFLRTPAALGPLPPYAVEVSGGTRTERGPDSRPDAPRAFAPGSLLTLTLRPRRPVAGPIAVLGLIDNGAAVVPWRPGAPFEVAGGAVRLRGTLGRDLRLPPGAWRIWIVVGRPGRLPAVDEVAAALRAGRTAGAGWRAAAADLRVTGRAP